ncbi:hypothetical protein B566_EDAN014406 [Ephemera danica]|nr:hypothetical protein B566_EDAN014406 [Ephemera danica]
MQSSSAWGRVVLLLVAAVAVLQVLHLILLSRLEARHQRHHHALQQQDDEVQDAALAGAVAANIDIHGPLNSASTSGDDAPLSVDAQFTLLVRALQRGGVLDSSGEYRLVSGLAPATRLPLPVSAPGSGPGVPGLPDVALATQCSVRHLPLIAELAMRWQGAVSVAVFAETRELGAALWGVARLRSCYPAVRHNVSFQLVTPLGAAGDHAPILPPPEAATSCDVPVPQEASMAPNYAHTRAPYPVNLLRNVARRAVQAEYVLLVDADMLPSYQLRERFHRFATKSRLFRDSQRDDKTVYVVPAFEARQGAVVPRDKAELLALSESGQLRPFYFELCWKCQVHTDYEAWQREPPGPGLAPLFEVLWKDPWEPFYIARNSAPLYDERFKQYGFNRISQTHSTSRKMKTRNEIVCCSDNSRRNFESDIPNLRDAATDICVRVPA